MLFVELIRSCGPGMALRMALQNVRSGVKVPKLWSMIWRCGQTHGNSDFQVQRSGRGMTPVLGHVADGGGGAMGVDVVHIVNADSRPLQCLHVHVCQKVQGEQGPGCRGLKEILCHNWYNKMIRE